jgi:N-carbamoyl-L-amino-acid hydrolase
VATINPERLLADLDHLRTFGATDNGVVRPSLSAVDIQSRHWLLERMQACGLDARIDGVGNVIGRSKNKGPALLIGSHSDTQPRGGWLDGALGVIYAIEIARALAENPATSHLAVDPVSWMDEESTFLG